MRAALIAAAVLASSVATAADEKQIRRDCRRDAVRYCTKEAARCAVAETPRCRAEIIMCMVANRDKFRPRCAVHIY